MRKVGRLLLLAVLCAGLLVWWRARGSKLGPVASVAPSPPAPSARARAAHAPGSARTQKQKPGDGAHAAATGEEGSAAITGRVVRADTGEPVPGAIVVSTLERFDQVTALADGAGRFRLEGLDAGSYRPIARAPGLYGNARESVSVGAGGTGAGVVVEVRPAASLRGRLELAATSAPCPGGVVELRSPVTGDVEATADAAGQVIFPALLPARYEVRLTCAGHAVNDVAPPVEVGDTAREVTFSVHEQLVVAGVVVDEHGDPEAPNTWIRARRADIDTDEPDARGYSREDGRFEVRLTRAGRYEVYADGRSDRLSEPVTVTVAEGAPVPEVRLVARPRYRLEGMVVDERGRPLSGARLRATQMERGEWHRDVGDDGRFELTALQAGKLRLSIEMGHDPLAVLSGETEPVMPVRELVTLVVRAPQGRIEGRVIRDGPGSGRVEIAIKATVEDNYLFDWVTAGDDGTFSARVRPDVDYEVRATTDRGETSATIHVRAGARVDLRLRPAATLRGTVRGAPRAFRVSLSDGADEVFFAPFGAWEIRGVPAGTMNVVVTADGLTAAEEVSVAPGETRSLDLTLAPEDAEP